jgi:hypothetical protein
LWRNFGLEKIRKNIVECSDPKDVISQILQLRRDLKLRTMALLWWRWNDRNKVVLGEKGNTDVNLLRLIIELLMISTSNSSELGSERVKRRVQVLDRCNMCTMSIKLNLPHVSLASNGQVPAV